MLFWRHASFLLRWKWVSDSAMYSLRFEFEFFGSTHQVRLTNCQTKKIHLHKEFLRPITPFGDLSRRFWRNSSRRSLTTFLINEQMYKASSAGGTWYIFPCTSEECPKCERCILFACQSLYVYEAFPKLHNIEYLLPLLALVIQPQARDFGFHDSVWHKTLMNQLLRKRMA